MKEQVLRRAAEAFGTQPEYLWSRDPESAVLRREDNAKWYAVFLTASRARLGLAGEGRVELLDVKCDPLMIGSLRQEPGFLPAYHMCKDKWLTILLDGSVPCGQILDLLEMSRALAATTGKCSRKK